MALTAISNVIVPEVFVPYMQEESDKANRLIQSGLLSNDPIISAKLDGGGTVFNMPHWRHISENGGDYVVPTDDNTVATPTAIVGRTQSTVRVERAKTFGAAKLSAALAGSDPVMAAATMLGNYRAAQRQRILISFLKGFLSASGMSATNDIAEKTLVASVVDANRIDADGVIDSQAPFGDFSDPNMMAMCIHSDVYRKLQKQNLITFEPTSAQNIGFGTYLGMTLIVDDQMPKTNFDTTGYYYSTYFVRMGDIKFGVGNLPANEAIEVHREPLEGNGGGAEYLITRDCFSYHLDGMKWVGGSVAGDLPTDAEIADGANNWALAAVQKTVGIAELIHNI